MSDTLLPIEDLDEVIATLESLIVPVATSELSKKDRKALKKLMKSEKKYEKQEAKRQQIALLIASGMSEEEAHEIYKTQKREAKAMKKELKALRKEEKKLEKESMKLRKRQEKEERKIQKHIEKSAKKDQKNQKSQDIEINRDHAKKLAAIKQVTLDSSDSEKKEEATVPAPTPVKRVQKSTVKAATPRSAPAKKTTAPASGVRKAPAKKPTPQKAPVTPPAPAAE